jgi:hypothetical protein
MLSSWQASDARGPKILLSVLLGRCYKNRYKPTSETEVKEGVPGSQLTPHGPGRDTGKRKAAYWAKSFQRTPQRIVCRCSIISVRILFPLSGPRLQEQPGTTSP